jgi:crossover junction endodeoxyribonuclease RuvC
LVQRADLLDAGAPVRVLGVDPGMANCGFAVIDSFAVRDLGVFETSKKRGDLMARLAELEEDITSLLVEFKPLVVVAEAPSFPRNARAAQMLGLSFGMLRGLCRGHGVGRFVVRTATEWREMLGLPKEKRGEEGKRRRKASTERYVRHRFPGAEWLLKGVKKPQHEHAYDALAIACTWSERAAGVMQTRRAA